MPAPLELLGALADLKKLRCLSIDASWVASHNHVLHLLERLPGLQSLRVESSTMPSLRDIETTLDDRHQNSDELPRQHQLQYLSVAGYLRMESILRDFAFHFPRLKALMLEGDFENLYSEDAEITRRLSQEISMRCPLLTDLGFKNVVCLDPQDLWTFLSSVTGLRRLSIRGMNLNDVQVMRILSVIRAQEPRVWDHIEHIELQCRSLIPPGLEDAILQTLSAFPMLKRLSLPAAIADADTMAKVIQARLLQAGLGGGWICKNLEELDLRITGPPIDWIRPGVVEGSIDGDQQKEVVEGDEVGGGQYVEVSARYNSFDTVVEYLRAQPKLNFQSVKFIQ
ncbi:unnamed protein product [Mortierella alpina]